MPSNAQKAAALSELIHHAKHGERNKAIDADTYAWLDELLASLSGAIFNGESDDKAIEITITSIEGAYHAV